MIADYVMSIAMKEGDDEQQFNLITPESNFSAGCLTFDMITIQCRYQDRCEVGGYIDVFTVNHSLQHHILREELNDAYEWHTIEGILPVGSYHIVFEFRSETIESDAMVWLANVIASAKNCTHPGGQ